ncbi:MAG TPA: M28 family peptidase [Bryobacteraceae bacterium]|jgi:Zn-dependent M28 family amino/carboxypeptidase|nr:M28 family peptidase [Bryobacteraceae bacterium]
MRTIFFNGSRRVPFVAAAALCVAGAAISATPKPKAGKPGTPEVSHYGNAESISQDELKIYLYFLASDQLEGRNLPSRGFDTAALYVASHLAEWGLKPGGSSSNTVGPLEPYFMPMELIAKTVVPAETKASVTEPARAGGRGRGGAETSPDAAASANAGPRKVDLQYGKDWTITTGGRGAAPLEPMELEANLVFAGNGYTIEKGNIDPYTGLDVKGKIVVVAGLPPELAAQQAAAGQGGPGGGGRGPNPLGENCKDFMTPEEAAAKNGAAAVITIVDFRQLSGTGGGGRGGASLNGPAYRVPKLASTAACPSAPAISAQLGMANAIFQGEKESASQIFYGAGAGTKQDSFALSAEKKISLKVATKTEENHGENVVAILEGSDPVLKNQYVIVSAHLDHIGFSAPLPDGDTINNGADDDGSGSAGLMAMAHAYADGAAKGMRPRRSIIFLWNAGEEKGLWGSQYFNQYPPVDPKKIVADLNMDMIGRTKGPGFTDSDKTHVLVDPGEVLLVGPNISSNDLEKTIETVNGGYQKLTLNHFYDVTKPDETHDNLGPKPNGQRIFYRSDHYNFAKVGIPIAFFTTGLHPDYHRPTDTADKIDYKEMQIISKTVAAVAWQLGNQDPRPEVNSTLPEQLIKDMKSAKDQSWGQVTPVLPPLPNMPY